VLPASGSYVLGAPQVPAAKLRLAGGKTLRVRAQGFSARSSYADRVAFNGRPVDPVDLRHAGLTGGGELRYYLRTAPE
jgi:putative alpha-1,2-mannosidase